MRYVIRHGFLSKFQDSYLRYLQFFSRCFFLRARVNNNMHENNKELKSEKNCDTSGTNTSPKGPDKRCSKVIKSKERINGCDINSKSLGIPETFSEAERQIFGAHKNAIEANSDTYKDPSTGYDVLTREALLDRGKCCGNACRHCPYDHINVPEQFKTKKFNSKFYI